MTRDDVLRMAREAGFCVLLPDEHIDEIGTCMPTDDDCLPEMERFAALVAAAEREECALLADSFVASGPVSEVQQRHNYAYMQVCDAIRARGES